MRVNADAFEIVERLVVESDLFVRGHGDDGRCLTTQAQRLRARGPWSGPDVIEQSKRATRSSLQRMVRRIRHTSHSLGIASCDLGELFKKNKNIAPATGRTPIKPTNSKCCHTGVSSP